MAQGLIMQLGNVKFGIFSPTAKSGFCATSSKLAPKQARKLTTRRAPKKCVKMH